MSARVALQAAPTLTLWEAFARRVSSSGTRSAGGSSPSAKRASHPRATDSPAPARPVRAPALRRRRLDAGDAHARRRIDCPTGRVLGRSALWSHRPQRTPGRSRGRSQRAACHPEPGEQRRCTHRARAARRGRGRARRRRRHPGVAVARSHGPRSPSSIDGCPRPAIARATRPATPLLPEQAMHAPSARLLSGS